MATGLRTVRIDEEVRNALSSIEWDGANAMLTCGQLDRKVYTKVNDALESLGGKWSRKAKAHTFSEAAHDELEALIETGEFVRGADIKQVFGEFETPDELADVLVERLGLHGDMPSILEPSAASGQLIKAIHRRGRKNATIVAIEIQAKRQAALEKIADEVHIRNFLDVSADELAMPFDFVAMNPPFARQADIDHVKHAWDFLADGGRLVAIMSSGWTFRDNLKSRLFRAFVEKHGTYEPNPEGAFKSSGTMVNTVMVTLDKPA